MLYKNRELQYSNEEISQDLIEKDYARVSLRMRKERNEGGS